ncbi:hypothetical protein [Xylanimonas protaetiae]|uniref:Uncharacterized protein n=1 Tax=Xylanimonas protaetiae TaxID=2509457 RepID=A0A4P6F076_9MICO|nr:hypothetical protein [Xylanimonas protaetiae]QAY69140.1 hypothetical protein ET471_03015 [Xylanimonas protaetiae]
MFRPRRILAATAAAAVLSVGAVAPAVAANQYDQNPGIPASHAWGATGAARAGLDQDGRGFVLGQNSDVIHVLANPVLLSSVWGLGYEVLDSTGWAPSLQLIVTDPDNNVRDARLVWEPYQQNPVQGPNNGTFTGLEGGRWWHANVWGSNPSGNILPQNQTPRDLKDFWSAGITATTGGQAIFGANTKVVGIALRQGSTTNATSVVPWVTINGTRHDFRPGGTAKPAPATVLGDWTVQPAPSTERETTRTRDVMVFDHVIDFSTWTWVHAATPLTTTPETETVANPAWVEPTPEPQPTPAPPAREAAAPPVADLTTELRSGTLVPAGQNVTAGAGLNVYVGTHLAGTWVDVFLFSDPVFLGRFLVAADGTVDVKVPATLAGDHRLTVADAATGEVVAWTEVAIAAAPGTTATGGAANAVPRGATGWAEGGVEPLHVALATLAGLAVVSLGTLVVRRVRA